MSRIFPMDQEMTSIKKVRREPINPSEEYHGYRWCIEDFSNYKEKLIVLNLPYETLPGKKWKWRVLLYPNGDGEENFGFLSVYLSCTLSAKAEILVSGFFSIVTRLGALNNRCPLRHSFSREETEAGYPQFMNRSHLLSTMSSALPDKCLLPDNTLTLHGEFEFSTAHPQITVPSCHLLDDYGRLLEQHTFSDITLNIGTRKFYAHKAILASRSPVFAAMLSHNMKEVRDSVVNITDMDADIMEALLHYIYTGKVPQMASIADGLLAAADKYDMEHLKCLCMEALCFGLNNSNVVSTLILAERHTCIELKSAAFTYITENVQSVLYSEEWKAMILNYPLLVNEAFLRYVERQNNRAQDMFD